MINRRKLFAHAELAWTEGCRLSYEHLGVHGVTGGEGEKAAFSREAGMTPPPLANYGPDQPPH